MLTIMNNPRGTQSDYSRADLKRCAQQHVKHEPDSDGKLRAWHLRVHEGAPAGATIQLCADYLTRDGKAKRLTVAL